MAKSTNALNAKLKYTLNFVRVPAFIAAAATRGKSAHFCRYSRISDDIIN